MDYIFKFIADYWLIVFSVLGLFSWGGYSSVTAPGRELRNKFASLGDLKGKTAEQIVAVVGKPSTSTNVGDNSICHWIKPGFIIGLVFNGEICEGIENISDTSEI